MLPGQLFGFRPHVRARDYRGPLEGLYLAGAGTWPGGYVTGIPGRNASRAVLTDLGLDGGARHVAVDGRRQSHEAPEATRWSS